MHSQFAVLKKWIKEFFFVHTCIGFKFFFDSGTVNLCPLKTSSIIKEVKKNLKKCLCAVLEVNVMLKTFNDSIVSRVCFVVQNYTSGKKTEIFRFCPVLYMRSPVSLCCGLKELWILYAI